ncbi:MAG: nucleotidyl transferase AbiEii/AbiGii toxin family protein [Vulcanimicrobiota bacterium]
MALKGGAAINLFLRNLPRLSGDLDSFLGTLAYTFERPFSDRVADPESFRGELT